MDILIIGGGGREHTLAWKIKQSPLVGKLYCIPGNAGISEIAICKKMDVEGDFEPLAQFVVDNNIDLTLIGPEDPLANGIVDYFEEKKLSIFGPSKAAAEIEGSKVFSKQLMVKYEIPTAKAEIFDDADEAKAYIERVGAPIVVKADGLAKGKGVIPCRELDKALKAVDTIMVEKAFGKAGDRVVIEEFLEGEEASFIAFTDGKTILPMASSQDHKPAYDGDEGPNTGGMGAYSPAPVVTDEVHELIMNQVMEPAVNGMAAEGRLYKGVLYAGLMIADGKPKVVEFNARFGDPETQAVLPRMKSDIVPIIQACIDGNLSEIQMKYTNKPAVCVVMASGGYPVKYEKGKVITGLDEANALKDVTVFHAGTAKDDDNVITNGGRVLGVTALGDDIKGAIDKAYTAVRKISFEKAMYRCDIGHRALNR
ncbi:phosphoribosylamine--glycine ligase [Candidatus Poribacteria bacterium]|nr:phosphoribosylamine--glycine ligase [Candidatus Poribacteria bacterium]